MLYPDPATREAKRAEYLARLDFETKTIVQMGFAGYFLIVADFINWAKRNGVPVGPGPGLGRGLARRLRAGHHRPRSAALRSRLRALLNPERVSMPDLDIDFCQNGRDRVIDYVKKKYGAESVSQIATFGTMAAKAAVRDVGRVLDLPYLFCDGIAKLIPFQPGKLVTLREARAAEPLLAEREQKEEEVRELLALAESLEGLTRNVGMHAGGVLIAPGKLTDFCPLYTQAGSDALVSQFDKDDVEAVGLVKFDFLGLTTLTILDWTLRYVKRLDPASDVAARDAAARRPRDLRHLQGGQYRRRVPVRIARDARADEAGAADPLRGHHRARRAVPARPDGAHPRLTPRARRAASASTIPTRRLEPILGPTYGVMVYQEQVMQIAQVIGGYTLGEADFLRRAMGKKDKEEMAKHRDIFVAGAEKQRRQPDEGDRALRPHGEVRRLRLQQVALGRLRAHRLPDRLFQGASSGGVHGGEPLAGDGRHRQGSRAARRRRSPTASRSSRQTSTRRTTASSRSTRSSIRYGLGGIKGTGAQAIEAIVAARDGRRPVQRPVRFLPAHRQARRQSPRGRSADPRRRVRLDRSAPRDALRFGRRRACPRRTRRRRSAAQVSLFGEDRERAGAHAHRDARMDGGRASRPREGGARVLPVRAPVRGVRHGARAAHPAVAVANLAADDASGA